MLLAPTKFTAAVSAKARPSNRAPVSNVMESKAMMIPAKDEFPPSVALLVTCQKTLAKVAPPIRTIEAPPSTFRADPTWKIKTAFGFPWPSRVTEPEISRVVPV